MKLIVGLGNPGKEYDKTRHNVGFMALDHFLKNEKFKTKNSGMYLQKKYENEQVIFLKPLSFMNNSGETVKKYVDYFNIKTEDILIVYDDVNFEVGSFKLKPDGSSGGHNGIKSIINNLSTKEIKRLKIGIGKKGELKSYVLNKFNKEELVIINNLFETTDNIIKDFIYNDFNCIMNNYNRS